MQRICDDATVKEINSTTSGSIEPGSTDHLSIWLFDLVTMNVNVRVTARVGLRHRTRVDDSSSYRADILVLNHNLKCQTNFRFERRRQIKELHKSPIEAHGYYILLKPYKRKITLYSVEKRIKDNENLHFHTRKRIHRTKSHHN